MKDVKLKEHEVLVKQIGKDVAPLAVSAGYFVKNHQSLEIVDPNGNEKLLQETYDNKMTNGGNGQMMDKANGGKATDNMTDEEKKKHVAAEKKAETAAAKKAATAKALAEEK